MYIKSPMNYTGGKYKILAQLFDKFPDNIVTFVDLFAGGFNVGINCNAEHIVCNDHINYLIELYSYFSSNSIDVIIDQINNRIKKYELTKQNVDGYNRLREKYNSNKDVMDLFVLTCFSFNHQIRFNNKLMFNTPFGKERSSYNKNIENNLIMFCKALHNKDIKYCTNDFMSLDLSYLGKDDLVYCDPPYLISTGSYNDGKRGFKDWGIKEEKELIYLLDKVNKQGTRFALSNVLKHKGEENLTLSEWSKYYHTTYIDKNYKNCSYHLQSKESETVEVLITNY